MPLPIIATAFPKIFPFIISRQTWLVKAFSLCAISMLIIVQAQAQGDLVNVFQPYDTDSKIKVEKGSNYKMEIKNGKLNIRHKGKIEKIVNYLYSGLDAYKECYDLHLKLELKFVEGDEKSSFGMEFYTYDSKRTTDYFNFIKFMLTGDGKLKFYSGADEKMIISKQPADPCPSFKPNEANTIEMIRNKKDWYLVINRDTVKHIVETALHPVVKLFTGNFLLEGTSEIELDNFSYVVRPDKENEEKKIKKLKAIEGSYLTFSSCLKNKTKRLTLKLKYEGGTKFIMTGLGKDASTLYLDEKEENVFSHYDNLSVEMGGEIYGLRKLKITQNSSGTRHNITFNMFTQDSKTITDCDFDGDQSFENTATKTEDVPAKPSTGSYSSKGKYVDGIALVQRAKKYGYIDESGKEIIPLIYDYAQDFSEGMAGVWENNKYGFIDKTGKLVIPIQYDETFLGYSNGLAAVGLGGKWGYIDKKGKIIVPLKYEKAMIFREGLVAVKLDGKWGYIDTSGKVIIAMKYDCGNSFSGGLSVACLSKKYGFINKKGIEIIPLIYDDTYGFQNGKVKMMLNGQPVYLDTTGKKVSE